LSFIQGNGIKTKIRLRIADWDLKIERTFLQFYYREHKIGYAWNHKKGVIASPKGVAISF